MTQDNTGPQFDPQPGDVMTTPKGGTYKVTKTRTDAYDHSHYVVMARRSADGAALPAGEATVNWWSTEAGATYARPVQAAPPVRAHLVLRAVADALRAYDKADDAEGGVPAHDILWTLLCAVEAATTTAQVGGTWTELATQVDAVALAVEGGAL